MIILLISIVCLIMLIGIIVNLKKAPVIQESYWRYNQYKKQIEILTFGEQINVTCNSLKDAREMMKYSNAKEL